MKKLTFVGALLLSSLWLSAQNVENRTSLSSFHAISVSNNFEVILQEGADYAIETSIDSRISDYCTTNVSGGVLVLKVDEKSFPKELKAQLKGKEKADNLKAVITVPSSNLLQKIELTDKAQLESHSKFTAANSLTINTSGNAVIKSLDVNSPQVSIIAANKSKIHIDVKSTTLQLTASNNADVNVEAETTNLDIKTDGNAEVTASAKCTNCVLNSSLVSKVNLKGTVDKLAVNAKDMTKIDAKSANANDVDVNLKSCECTVTPLKTLRINISGGAKLIFDGAPVITIDKIAGSSVTNARDVKKK